jgi:TolB protein
VNRLTLLIFLLSGPLAIAAGDRRIAFERAGAVHIANPDVTVVRKLTDGTWPSISPDGTRIVFSTVETNATTYARYIGVVETTSGKITAFKNIPSDNCYQASWSPRGDLIAFVFSTNGIIRLGTVKADGTGFKLIRNNIPDEKPIYSPCWARDGLSIFCHNTSTLYRVALDGSILAQWSIGQIVPNGAMSADGRLDVSPDGQRLLLSVDMDEEYDRRDWDGPVPALWIFDLGTQTAARLTSKNLFAWDGCWLDDANMLFLTQRTRQKQASIYRTYGKDLKRLIEDAHRPSISKP